MKRKRRWGVKNRERSRETRAAQITAPFTMEKGMKISSLGQDLFVHTKIITTHWLR
jgi:hypothetical protein